MMELRTFNSRDIMSRAVAKYTAALIKKNTDSGSVFTLALSGGRSPVLFYELLAEESVDWSMVKLFLVDDRKVEQTHPDSNALLIRTTLLTKINIPAENIFFPNTSIESPIECAREYEMRLKEYFGESLPVFNLIVLGVGPDGHTASLFPGADHGLDAHRLIISTKAPDQFKVADRISMTMDLINNGSMRIFVVSGEGKQDIVQRTVAGDKSIPAGLIKNPCLIFSDSVLS